MSMKRREAEQARLTAHSSLCIWAGEKLSLVPQDCCRDTSLLVY